MKIYTYCIVLSSLVTSTFGNMESYRRLAMEHVKKDFISTEKEFQVSFKGEAVPLEGIKMDNYGYSTLPIFTSLSPDRTSLQAYRKRCLWIQFNPLQSLKHVPETIKAQLEQVKQKQGNIIANIVVYTHPIRSHTLGQKDTVEQLLFQTWVAGWLQPEHGLAKNFCKTIRVGIFNESGVNEIISLVESKLPPKMPLDTFVTQEICYQDHAFKADKPIRVSFNDYGTFWSVATSQDNKHAILTLHIVPSTEILSNTIVNIAQSAKNLRELLQKWYQQAGPILLQHGRDLAYSQARFLDILRLIRNLINGSYPEPAKNMLDFTRLALSQIWDNAGMGNDLQISFKGDGEPINAPKTNKGYATNVPFISPYGWSQYVSTPRQRRVWATFDIKNRFEMLPKTVQNILDIAKPEHIIGNIVVFGQPYLAFNGKEYPQETNMRLHGWVATWAKPGELWPNNFNTLVDMGLFESYGIQSSRNTKNAIGIGTLKTQNVHYHNAFSPNNAKFIVNQKRDIANFWLVALSQDKKNALVSYCLLFNSEKLGTKEREITLQSMTMRELLEGYKELTPIFQTEDQAAYVNALTTIYRLLDTVSSEQALYTALTNLQKSLHRLQVTFTQ